jgi:hypothetical protein
METGELDEAALSEALDQSVRVAQEIVVVEEGPEDERADLQRRFDSPG